MNGARIISPFVKLASLFVKLQASGLRISRPCRGRSSVAGRAGSPRMLAQKSYMNTVFCITANGRQFGKLTRNGLTGDYAAKSASVYECFSAIWSYHTPDARMGHDRFERVVGNKETTPT